VRAKQEEERAKREEERRNRELVDAMLAKEMQAQI
jgi:hypothetical protein